MGFQISPDNLHHAYGISGKDIVPSMIIFFQEELGVLVSANPDFFHEQFETLTVDDSRRIKELALSKRFSPEIPRIFLIELYGATREAQNALLKLLEEPEEGNHFFLVMPSFDILLPTLRSRLALVHAVSEHDAASTSAASAALATDFLKKPLKEKIVFVDGFAADVSDEKLAKHEALLFLNGLERALYDEHNLAKNTHALEAIARARSFAGDRAPSMKMLLEYVALAL